MGRGTGPQHLHNLELTLSQLARITHLFPTLTSLVASSNLYTTLSPEDIPLSIITDLSLEDNLIFALSSLSPLCNLPHLQRLILKSNKISSTTASGLTPPIFSLTVTEVDLSYNEITTWPFIDALETIFPGLTSLRVSHNPLYQNLQTPDGRALTAEDGYMLTLARLANLKTLNYSPITPKERLNAESYYLSLIAKEVSFASENLEAQILASHPRYAYLCEEYGEPVFHHHANQINPNSLAARLIRIKFYSAGGKHFETEIPVSFTAYTLLGMVSKHFDIKPMKCRLIWETGDWMHAPRAEDIDEEDWDSESDVEEEKPALNSIMREVEIIPGTRSVGTWIEGMEATVRIEER